MPRQVFTRRRLFSSAFLAWAPSLSAATGDYTKAILADKPVGYWRLGESNGTAATDSSGKGHHGIYKGGARQGQKGALPGDTDGAVVLDGGGAHVEIPDHPDFSPVTSGKGMTVEVWMMPAALEFSGGADGEFVHWLGKGMPGSHEWALRFYTAGSERPNRVSAYIFNPDGGLGSGAYFEERLKPGEWMHLVACYDPGDKSDPKAGVSIYHNGVMRKGPSIPGSSGTLYSAYNIVPAHGSAPLRLGTRDLKSFLNGALDEVAIYPRVLSAREIMAHYRAGRRR